MKILFSIFLVLIVSVSGCKKHEETVTSGRGDVLTADPYLPLIKQEVDQFISLYPEVKIEAFGASTREAIVHLLNDSVHSIIIDRPFNEEEQQVAQQAAIQILQNKIAEDGVAIIVNKQNPISSITVESVRRIVSSDVTDWKEISEARLSGSIDFVLTDRNSGMYELFQKQFFSLTKQLEPTVVMKNQRDVIQYVSQHLQAVGFVAASLVIGETDKIKMLSIKTKSPEGNEKEYLPYQQEIHDSLYPFHYSLYLYNVEAKSNVSLGFSALVLSNVGQKIIQKAGLVPASIPYRTIQLTAE